MFKLKQKLDNIYDLLINFNNNERKNTKVIEDLMRSYEKSNIELTKELESEKEKSKILEIITKSQGEEIIRLTKIIAENNKFQEKVEQHLETVATIAKNVHKSRLEKKMNAVAYTRNNMIEEAKANLK